ncbi:MAG TPA: EAL domain-containing protein [Xanthobacteraceae bacterium]|jgi:cyclic-di-GMP phosphodiesterase TipF (flagellum assembly factor)|nr:EAL domain-containing protein [Xanthobacteraceae bacterium]
MGRLTAIFVAICMVLIAFSIGAVLYLRFGVSGADSAIVGLTALTALALYNAVSTRLYDRGDFGGQLNDLSRGTAQLARQVADVNRRVAAIEGNAHAVAERTLDATHPITAEMGEVGGLIKQIAETVAAHDTQLKELAPGGAAVGATSVPAVKAMPEIPIAPVVAAPAADDRAPKPAAANELKSVEPATPAAFQAAPVEATPVETKPVQVQPTDAPPGEAPPVATAAFDAKPSESAPADPSPVEAALSRIGSGRFKDVQPSAVVAIIREAVEANRVDLFLQPIVTLPQRKVRFYEAVARLRAGDGEQLMAGDFLSHAEAGGLMPKIDNLMVFRCVQVVRRLLSKNREIGLFCNVSATSLADAGSFPQFLEFLETNKAIAPALVFEFTQSALRRMSRTETENLAALAQRGYRFSLDNVTDLRIEPRDLSERGFRYVKVQASLLLNRAAAPTDIHPADFAGLLSRFGIDLIAAKIENESSAVDLLDYDVKFGQGFLFSPPRPVRPEVMQGVSERNDVVARDAGPPAAATPVAGHRLTSLAQLARGVVARG